MNPGPVPTVNAGRHVGLPVHTGEVVSTPWLHCAISESLPCSSCVDAQPIAALHLETTTMLKSFAAHEVEAMRRDAKMRVRAGGAILAKVLDQIAAVHGYRNWSLLQKNGSISPDESQPYPCGWAGDPSGRCRCHPDAIARYRGRISGPLLERIDLHVEVPRLPPTELRPDAPPGEASDAVRARVVRARERQHARAGRCNAHLDQSQTNAICRLAPEDQAMLENAIDLLQLSARSMHRILRVARTIADLAGSADILGPHVAEAIGYRRGE